MAASLYVAALYDASDFASIQPDGAVAGMSAYLYNSLVDGEKNVHLNKKRKKVIVRGLQGHRILV
ncbi:hypothetical protein MJ579_02915 [Klebsiella pneumoniae]|nr:hypothetical protein MJ579_02915 [Klebsiella pneumoniae]